MFINKYELFYIMHTIPDDRTYNKTCKNCHDTITAFVCDCHGFCYMCLYKILGF